VGCCGGGVLGNDAIYSVALKGEDYIALYDFGERISGLSGYAYRDNNDNGLRDEGTSAYVSVGTVITLYGQTTLGQLVTRAVSTDGFGFYFFQ
jgi:hypothetical protein